MHTVLIVIHLMVVLALVGVVLLQRSEGGALGIGGGGGGGFMSARGAANVLTRTTAILAATFFATSIALGVLAKIEQGPGSILDRVPISQDGRTEDGIPVGEGGGVLDLLGPSGASEPAPPAVGEPAPPSAIGEPAAPQAPAGQ